MSTQDEHGGLTRARRPFAARPSASGVPQGRSRIPERRNAGLDDVRRPGQHLFRQCPFAFGVQQGSGAHRRTQAARFHVRGDKREQGQVVRTQTSGHKGEIAGDAVTGIKAAFRPGEQRSAEKTGRGSAGACR